MKRILVINPFGIGDVIFSMVIVQALRLAFPDAFIGFVCNERTIDLVRMNSSIDRVFEFNRDLFREYWKKSPFLFFKKLKMLLRTVKDENFDTLFDFSLGKEYSFFAMWIGINKRIGFDYKGRGIFLTVKEKIQGYENEPVADTQLRLLRKAGLSYEKNKLKIPFVVSDKVKKETNSFLKQRGCDESDVILAVAPGGGRSWGSNAIYKQWDPDRFSEVINRVQLTKDFKIILLGDATEQILLDKTAHFLRRPPIVVAGEAFEKVCAILQRSEILLCNDGGLLHLANALGVKTVSIFGPVDEKVYGPYFTDKPWEILTEDVPCRPCYNRFHFPPCPYERRCLSELGIDKVAAMVGKVLNLNTEKGEMTNAS